MLRRIIPSLVSGFGIALLVCSVVLVPQSRALADDGSLLSFGTCITSHCNNGCWDKTIGSNPKESACHAAGCGPVIGCTCSAATDCKSCTCGSGDQWQCSCAGGGTILTD